MEDENLEKSSSCSFPTRIRKKIEENVKPLLNVPIPKNEKQRLIILQEAKILDTDKEESYDRYTMMAARLFKVPIALISLIDFDRQWFKSRVGLPAPETHRNYAFCTYAILEESPAVFIVPNALRDPRFAQNPLVLGPPFIRFYAGASLIIDEVKVGTLCIIDTIPRGEDHFGSKQIALLEDLAMIVSNLIKQRRQDHLFNIYQTLLMNADIMKLFQIPLHNLNQSYQTMKTLFSSLKEYYQRYQQLQEKQKIQMLRQSPVTTKISFYQSHVKVRVIINKLFHEIQYFAIKVNRSSILSLLLSQLFLEIYHLEKYEALNDNLQETNMSSTQRKAFDQLEPRGKPMIEGSDHIRFDSLTQMNLFKLQSRLKEYYQTTASKTTSLRPLRRASGVDLTSLGIYMYWNLDQLCPALTTANPSASTKGGPTETQSSSKGSDLKAIKASKTAETAVRIRSNSINLSLIPQNLYSYPTLIELVLMIIFDCFDFHHHQNQQQNRQGQQQVVITIEPIKKYTQFEAMNQSTLITSGHWWITIALNDSHPQSIHSFLDIFRIIERIRNCSHYLSSSSSRLPKTENQQEEVGGGDEGGKRRNAYRIYNLEIPFYDFQLNQDNYNRIFLNKEFSRSQTESQIPINANILTNYGEDASALFSQRIKPSSSSSVANSMLSLPFVIIRQQFHQYQNLLSVRHDKIHSDMEADK